jgi:hypothetical protein
LFLLSEPSIPGPVTSSENDLDASDGIITITWTAGTGVATSYRVKLFDGDTQKGSQDTSSFPTTFNDVLNGYRYNVSIIAWSESFDGRYINSEESVSAIKTIVQGKKKCIFFSIVLTSVKYIQVAFVHITKKEI